MTTRYNAPTVAKAFQILRLVARSSNGLKISDLARDLALSKSSVHGITAALEQQGVLVREGRSKRYTLGLALIELGHFASERIDLKDVARPVIEDLMHKTGESVFLGLRNGSRVTVLDSVESMSNLKITAPAGSSIPLLAGALGKAFLAALSGTQAADLVAAHGLKAYTARSITDPARYLKELDQVRRAGYAVDKEEYISGVRAVAALIRASRPFPSVICVVGFASGLDDQKIDRVSSLVLAAVRAIGDHLQPKISLNPKV